KDGYAFPVTGDGPWDGHRFERIQNMGDGCQPIEWTVDGQQKKIRYKITSANEDDDWVAVGLSENGGMRGADINIVKEIGPNVYAADDTFSMETEMPKSDVLQNTKLLSAWRDESGRLVGVIEKDLDTCDKDDLLIEPYKQHLICASGRGVTEDGDITYHGRNRHSNTVNLLLDEELLMDRKFPVDVDLSKGVEVEPGIIFYDDPGTATVPYAVDVNLLDVTLDQKATTSYMCRVFTNINPMQVVAYEAVWDNGTTVATGTPPEYLHHELLLHCAGDRVDMDHMDGQPFDCYKDMPACDATFNHAKSGLIQSPPGTSVKMHPGVFVLQVHYDNTYQVPIKNDSSGIRFWVLPDEQAKMTQSGNIVNHVGQLASIRIPADPLQRDFPLQMMISSEATRATLPETGIQVFGVSLHMHKAGLRGRLQLIRDGENILDVYDYRSYDFNMQAPNLKRWRILPGDAMVVTCIFKPNKDTDIVGGLRTEDEMCNFAIGFSPELPNYRSGVGYLVKPDEPFRKSFIGNVPNTTRGLYMPEDLAPFAPDKRGWVDLRDYREDYCEMAIRDETSLFSFNWGDANVYALYIAIGTFFACLFLEYLVPSLKNIQNLRAKRNAVICIIQLVFSTGFLIPLFVLAAPIFKSNDTFNAYEVDTYNALRGIIATQILLYVLELFYKLKIRVEVVVHHIITAALFIFLNHVAAYSYAFEYATKLGAILILLAMLDQPKNLALLLKYLGYANTKWWPTLCKVAAVWYMASKLAVISVAIFFMYESSASGNEKSWSVPGHSFSKWMPDYKLNDTVVIGVVSAMMFLLMLDQIFTTRVLWKLALKVGTDGLADDEPDGEKDLIETAMPASASASSTDSDGDSKGIRGTTRAQDIESHFDDTDDNAALNQLTSV
ncbi:hypothetical protein ACHAXR_008856, partial [Thalassiosira sp. AJA248-18]